MQSGAVDEVWLMPCGDRPDKATLTTSVMHRSITCQLSVNARFQSTFPVHVCDLEVYEPQFIPTLFALQALNERYNGVS